MGVRPGDQATKQLHSSFLARQGALQKNVNTNSDLWRLRDSHQSNFAVRLVIPSASFVAVVATRRTATPFWESI